MDLLHLPVPAPVMRLLLIEDDPAIARELKLRWDGGPWLVAHVHRLDGADAAIACDAYDLILLDLGMPDGDGIVWLRTFRARDPRTPVMVLTARDRVAERVEGLRAGADDYLVKPYAADELDARIDVLLRRTPLVNAPLQPQIVRHAKDPAAQIRPRLAFAQMPEQLQKDVLRHLIRLARRHAHGNQISYDRRTKLVIQRRNLVFQARRTPSNGRPGVGVPESVANCEVERADRHACLS